MARIADSRTPFASSHASTGAASPGSTTAAHAPVAQGPDVVVPESGDGDNRRHGCNPPIAVETLSTTLAAWLTTPLGEYLQDREQAYFDETVADIFGFHALQIGLPECPFLAQSRIVSKWTLDYDPPADIIADPHGLPFAREYARPDRACRTRSNSPTIRT